jgi:hypothetical protein
MRSFDSKNPSLTVIRIDSSNTGMRMRRVVRRSNMRVTGKYPSIKNNASVQWESTIERDCYALLEADGQIRSYNEQPVVIHYEIDGNPRRHTPDILINCHGRLILCEVKSAADPLLNEAIALGAALAPALGSFGYSYYIVTDLDIRLDPYLSNAKLLTHYGRASVDDMKKEELRRAFARGPIGWRQILEGSIGKNAVFSVARMILEGRLFYDTTKKLEYAMVSDSPLRISQEVWPWQ